MTTRTYRVRPRRRLPVHVLPRNAWSGHLARLARDHAYLLRRLGRPADEIPGEVVALFLEVRADDDTLDEHRLELGAALCRRAAERVALGR